MRDPFELFVDRREELARGVAFARRGVDLEEPRIPKRSDGAVDVDGDFHLSDELSIDPRGASSEEHFGEQRERRMVEVAQRRCVIADHDLLGRRRLRHLDDAARRRLRRLGNGVFERKRGRLDVAVGFHDQLERAPLRHVTDYHDGRIVRRVVGVVEAAAVLGREAFDVLHPADRRPFVGVLRERRGPQDLADGAFHVVVDAIAAFVRDHFLLARHLRIPEHQLPHPLRFEPRHEGQAIVRDRDVVLRPVEPRRGVALRARFFEFAIELAGLHVLRLVEHQMFEQVREPRLADLFVSRPDAVPRVVRDDRCRVILADQNAKAVREPEAFDGQRRPERHGAFVSDALRATARKRSTRRSTDCDVRSSSCFNPV